MNLFFLLLGILGGVTLFSMGNADAAFPPLQRVRYETIIGKSKETLAIPPIGNSRFNRFNFYRDKFRHFEANSEMLALAFPMFPHEKFLHIDAILTSITFVQNELIWGLITDPVLYQKKIDFLNIISEMVPLSLRRESVTPDELAYFLQRAAFYINRELLEMRALLPKPVLPPKNALPPHSPNQVLSVPRDFPILDARTDKKKEWQEYKTAWLTAPVGQERKYRAFQALDFALANNIDNNFLKQLIEELTDYQNPLGIYNRIATMPVQNIHVNVRNPALNFAATAIASVADAVIEHLELPDLTKMNAERRVATIADKEKIFGKVYSSLKNKVNKQKIDAFRAAVVPEKIYFQPSPTGGLLELSPEEVEKTVSPLALGKTGTNQSVPAAQLDSPRSATELSLPVQPTELIITENSDQPFELSPQTQSRESPSPVSSFSATTETSLTTVDSETGHSLPAQLAESVTAVSPGIAIDLPPLIHLLSSIDPNNAAQFSAEFPLLAQLPDLIATINSGNDIKKLPNLSEATAGNQPTAQSLESFDLQKLLNPDALQELGIQLALLSADSRGATAEVELVTEGSVTSDGGIMNATMGGPVNSDSGKEEREIDWNGQPPAKAIRERPAKQLDPEEKWRWPNAPFAKSIRFDSIIDQLDSKDTYADQLAHLKKIKAQFATQKATELQEWVGTGVGYMKMLEWARPDFEDEQRKIAQNLFNHAEYPAIADDETKRLIDVWHRPLFRARVWIYLGSLKSSRSREEKLKKAETQLQLLNAIEFSKFGETLASREIVRKLRRDFSLAFAELQFAKGKGFYNVALAAFRSHLADTDLSQSLRAHIQDRVQTCETGIVDREDQKINPETKKEKPKKKKKKIKKVEETTSEDETLSPNLVNEALDQAERDNIIKEIVALTQKTPALHPGHFKLIYDFALKKADVRERAKVLTELLFHAIRKRFKQGHFLGKMYLELRATGIKRETISAAILKQFKNDPESLAFIAQEEAEIEKTQLDIFKSHEMHENLDEDIYAEVLLDIASTLAGEERVQYLNHLTQLTMSGKFKKAEEIRAIIYADDAQTDLQLNGYVLEQTNALLNSRPFEVKQNDFLRMIPELVFELYPAEYPPPEQGEIQFPIMPVVLNMRALTDSTLSLEKRLTHFRNAVILMKLNGFSTSDILQQSEKWFKKITFVENEEFRKIYLEFTLGELFKKPITPEEQRAAIRNLRFELKRAPSIVEDLNLLALSNNMGELKKLMGTIDKRSTTTFLFHIAAVREIDVPEQKKIHLYNLFLLAVYHRLEAVETLILEELEKLNYPAERIWEAASIFFKRTRNMPALERSRNIYERYHATTLMHDLNPDDILDPRYRLNVKYHDVRYLLLNRLLSSFKIRKAAVSSSASEAKKTAWAALEMKIKTQLMMIGHEFTLGMKALKEIAVELKQSGVDDQTFNAILESHFETLVILDEDRFRATLGSDLAEGTEASTAER